MSDLPLRSAARVPVTRVGEGPTDDHDWIAVEEPLEIRIEGTPFAVTMRTPGHDLELAAGYLFGEGVIEDAEDLAAIAHIDDPADPQGNTLDVRLAPGVPLLRASARARVANSACGVCGKAALFSPDGALEVQREDIGRHNAVDKVIGWRLAADRLPIDDRILLVSGRAGFEIVQKALVARIPVLASVGAPSSLAVQLAESAGMTLIGFLRDGRYNVYADRR